MDLLISITSTQVSGSRLWAEDVNLGAFISVFCLLICSENLRVVTEEVGYAGEKK